MDVVDVGVWYVDVSSIVADTHVIQRHVFGNAGWTSQLKDVLIADLVEQLLDSYFERDRARISVDIPDSSLEANVDDVRIVLILKNLIGNAIRYSSGGDGSIVIGARREDHELVLSVQDEGPGISDLQLENFAEPFYRGDPSRTRDTGGTGLGLYLAKLAVEAHGGTLDYDREFQSGARLVARLPG